MFDSPILWLAGGVILIGGTWYAIRKWTGAGDKCLDKKTLAEVVESVLHGSKTSAEARKLAGALEKDGCAAADVKSIRDAADARDAKDTPKCPPANYEATIASVATMTLEGVSSLAATWEASGCATEAKALKTAFAAALKKAALPLKITKPGDFVPDPTPPPSGDAPPVEGWPKVSALPSDVYTKVYPAVSKVSWHMLWRNDPPTYLSDVCPGGAGVWGCSSSKLIDAANVVKSSVLGGLGGLTEDVQKAAVIELQLAAERLKSKEPAASTTGMPPYLRRRRVA